MRLAGRCRLNSLEIVVSVFFTAQKTKFFIKDFFSKCDQCRRKLRILSHLLKKSLMENFIFVQCFNVMPLKNQESSDFVLL